MITARELTLWFCSGFVVTLAFRIGVYVGQAFPLLEAAIQ